MKNLLRASTIALAVAAAVATPAFADSLGDDPRAIMEAVEARDTGDKMTGRTDMVITSAGGDKRKRRIRSSAIKVDGGTKHLLLFEAPADMRNTALLSIDYDSGAKSDDQWIYLPSMRKTVRISGGDKSGAFVGSDFSYNDMTKHHADRYEYKLLKKSTKVGGEDCWLIEARPNSDDVREETGYIKSHIWISKEKLMALQAKAWIRAGKKIKLMKFGGVKKIDGIWVAHDVAARTTRNGEAESTTTIRLSNVKFGDDTVSADDFTQRRMEQGL
jgi:outer membrane lipoprotein-sorting protein